MRRYGGHGGGSDLGARFRRVVGDPGNPLAWSVPLYRLWGIEVRLHLVFIIFLLGELIRGAVTDVGLAHTAAVMGGLFGLVLLHEYGHCFACRAVGGEADRIMLWPLGGLAYVDPPHEWKANLITTLGGPAVNAALLPVLGFAVLGLTGSWSHVVFNPFAPWAAQPLGGPVVTLVWWLHYLNFLLLAFNMLLPMYPMDAGRTLQNLLWARLGYRRAQEIAVTAGFVVALAVGLLGMYTEQMILFAIAIFAGLTCFMERQRLQSEPEEFGAGVGYSDAAYDRVLREQQEGPSKAEIKRRKREEAEQVELDRILAKIAEEGMGGLSRTERNFLQRTSARKRKGG